MVKKGSALEQAMEELKKLSGDPGFSEIVQARAKEIMDDVSFRSAAKRQGIREGYEEGKEQGIKEGKEQGIKEGKQQGIKEGKQQGIKQGQQNEKIEIAKKLLEEGVDIAIIETVTGLDKKEIEKL